MKRIFVFMGVLLLAACNSVYMKPHTIDSRAVVYADSGGYSMRRSIKEVLEKRGYNVVVVGRVSSEHNWSDDSGDIEMDYAKIPSNVRYVVKVSERKEIFMPLWCALNGFWWWNFNVSIADQITNQEILSWRGRGCANSSLGKLENILDRLEK